MRFLACLLSIAFSVSAWGACELKAGASATLKLGPFVDAGDFVTPETALDIDQADVRISKNGGNFAAKSDTTNNAPHDEDGFYGVSFNGTDTGSEGVLTISIQESGAAPFFQDCLVVGARFYDLKYGSTSLLDDDDVGQRLETTVSSVTSQTELVLAGGDSNDDAYNNSVAWIQGGTEGCERSVADYVGASSTLTLVSACDFTVAAGDSVRLRTGPAGPALATAQSDLDIITGTSGAVLDPDSIDDNVLASGAINEIRAGILDADLTNHQTSGTLGAAIGDGDAGAGMTEAGGDGDHLGALPYNAAWDAEIQSEASDALTAYGAVEIGDLPTNFADLAITQTTGRVTVGTNNDKSGYTIAGSKNTLDDLNDVAAADVWTFTCEDQGTISCGNAIKYILSEAVGAAEAPADGTTWTLKSPNGVDTRVQISYGTDDGDRSSVTLTP